MNGYFRGSFIALGLFITLALALFGATAPALGQVAQGSKTVAQDAQQPPRFALVIGNANYPSAPLRNSVHDAESVATKLKELGFTVTLVTNSELRPMQLAIIKFGEELKGGGVGLFYYAGHGLQLKGRNYLVPTDAHLDQEAEVRVEAVDVDLVTEQMLDANNGMNLIILDACRNDPFERRFRGGSHGLAAIDAAQGTLIAYATSPGSVAADGDGENGVYTEALLQALSEPDLKVEDVFKRVRIAVAERTHKAQMPWESSSLMGDFVFNPRRLEAPQPQLDPAALEEREGEIAFWNSVASSTNSADFEDYLSHYPNGEYAGLAQRRLHSLKATALIASPPAAAAPAVASPPASQPIAVPPVQVPKNTPSPTKAATEPEMLSFEGTFRVITTTSFRTLPDDNSKAVAFLKAGDDVIVFGKSRAGDWYRAHLQGGPEGYVASAAVVETAALEEAQWQRISARPSVATIGAFLKQFPNGHRSAEATAELEALRKSPATANKLNVDQPAAIQTSISKSNSPRCNSISEHSQLGEPITDADRVFLSNNCH